MGVALCNLHSACRPRRPATQHGAARLRAPLAVLHVLPLLLLAVICFAVHGVGPASAQPPPPPPPPPPPSPPQFVPRPGNIPFPPAGVPPKTLHHITHMHAYMACTIHVHQGEVAAMQIGLLSYMLSDEALVFLSHSSSFTARPA